jgi:hypothetical protein
MYGDVLQLLFAYNKLENNGAKSLSAAVGCCTITRAASSMEFFPDDLMKATIKDMLGTVIATVRKKQKQVFPTISRKPKRELLAEP